MSRLHPDLREILDELSFGEDGLRAAGFALGVASNSVEPLARFLYDRYYTRPLTRSPVVRDAQAEKAFARHLGANDPGHGLGLRLAGDGPDGFLHTRGITPARPAPALRVYFASTPCAVGPLLAAVRRLDGDGVPYSFKTLASPERYFRADASVLYVPRAHAADALRTVLAAHPTYAIGLRERGPRLTQPVAWGVSTALDPQASTGLSFGQWATRRIAEGTLAALAGPQDPEAAIEAAFRAAGGDAAAPWLANGGEHAAA